MCPYKPGVYCNSVGYGCSNCSSNPYRLNYDNWYLPQYAKKRITVEKLDDKGVVIERTITEEF